MIVCIEWLSYRGDWHRIIRDRERRSWIVTWRRLRYEITIRRCLLVAPMWNDTATDCLRCIRQIGVMLWITVISYIQDQANMREQEQVGRSRTLPAVVLTVIKADSRLNVLKLCQLATDLPRWTTLFNNWSLAMPSRHLLTTTLLACSNDANRCNNYNSVSIAMQGYNSKRMVLVTFLITRP